MRIRASLPELAPAELRVAEVVLRDLATAAACSITAIAGLAETSEATVVRFCRAVGLSGYPQLRLDLAREAGRSSADDGRVIGADITPDDDLSTVVEKIAYADSRAILDTAEQLDVAAIERVAEAIAVARRIEVFGVGASAFVAGDLAQKLRRIGLAAFLSVDAHAALTAAVLLEPGDVALGVSHSGTTVDTLDPLVVASGRRATTVAVTNFPRSPLALAAEVVLTTAARETTFRSGATASRIAQLTVVDCLFVAVARLDHDAAAAALAATYDAVATRRSTKRQRG